MYSQPPSQTMEMQSSQATPSKWETLLKQLDLIELEKAVPDLIIELKYASEDNFMGEAIYPTESVALLRTSTAEKLRKAQEMFVKQGFRIKVYDAFRPLRSQQVLYNAAPDKSFVANPNGSKGSNHSRGCAVDMTLVDSRGKEVVMPSAFDDFTGKGSREQKMSEEAQRNLRMTESIMSQCGFRGIAHEWWHYEDVDSEQYDVLDLDFTLSQQE